MFKKLLQFSFSALVLLTLAFAFWRFGFPLILPKAGQLSVNTPFQNSTVYLDGKKVGPTPFYSKNLAIGDHTLKVTSESATWETKTTLSAGVFSTLDLNLSKVDRFNSGESLFFRSGESSLIITSKPEGAKVFINNEEKGVTPLKLTPSIGVNNLTLKKEGYLPRELHPNIVKNYRLTANIFLSVDPFGQVKKLDTASKLTLFSLHNPKINLSESYEEWANGIVFTQKQFTSAETRFDVLLDPTGKVYLLNETEWKNKVATKSVANIGYLSNKENDTLSEKAATEWQKLKSQLN